MKFKNLLQQADYTLILPAENVRPLDLILRKEKNIFSIFVPNQGQLIHSSVKDLFLMAGRGSKYPDIKEQALPANLRGSDLIDGSGSFAAKFIAKARFQANATVKKSKQMLFSYKDAKELSVNFIRLDEYLLSSRLNASSPTFNEAVKAGNIFIITSALTSKELELKNAGNFDFSGDLTADLLTDIVDGSVNSTYNAEDKYVIKSSGDVSLTFAIKAVRILYDNEKFRIRPERINVRGEYEEMENLAGDEAVFIE